jgi:hypothetical protein
VLLGLSKTNPNATPIPYSQTKNMEYDEVMELLRASGKLQETSLIGMPIEQTLGLLREAKPPFTLRFVDANSGPTLGQANPPPPPQPQPTSPKWALAGINNSAPPSENATVTYENNVASAVDLGKFAQGNFQGHKQYNAIFKQRPFGFSLQFHHGLSGEVH